MNPNPILWNPGDRQEFAEGDNQTCSNRRFEQASGWPDSNRRPPAPKAGALTKLRHSP